MDATSAIDRLRRGIGTWEVTRVNREVGELGAVAVHDEATLLAIIDLAPAIQTAYPLDDTHELAGRQFQGKQFETGVWGIGDAVRRLLLQNRKLRRLSALWQRVEKLALDRSYGRGRESFVMLLGQYGGPARAPLLKVLLNDPKVAGHALYAMRLIGSSEALPYIDRFLESPKAWVRSEARKYLKKVRRYS